MIFSNSGVIEHTKSKLSWHANIKTYSTKYQNITIFNIEILWSNAPITLWQNNEKIAHVSPFSKKRHTLMHLWIVFRAGSFEKNKNSQHPQKNGSPYKNNASKKNDTETPSKKITTSYNNPSPYSNIASYGYNHWDDKNEGFVKKKSVL